MNYKEFTHKELLNILDVVQSAIRVKDETGFCTILEKIRELVCADYAVCGLGEVRKDRLSRIVRIVNLNYSDEWLNAYAAEKLFQKDPIIRCQFQFFGTHLWSEAFKLFSEEPYLRFMHLASDFGLKYGIASGVNGPGLDTGSIFSFAGEKKRFTTHHKKILDILIPHVHQALLRVCRRADLLTRAALTEREKEVIQWMKEGKTNWEISKILNISERTVKFHIRNIQDKLDAVNKTHAVAIAMEQSLIS